MAKAILKLDKTIGRISKMINTQLVIGKKLMWESRKSKTVIIMGGIRLGETAETGSTVVKMTVKSHTYETKVSIPEGANKVVVTAKLTGIQKIMGHLGFIGKGFVTSSLIAGKGVKFTAKAK